MAIVIPYGRQTWTDGSGGGTPVSAARLAVIEEGIVDVSQGPAVRVFHNTTQSATSAVELVLAFNSERFDQAGGAAAAQHDTVTNNSRLTCLYAGIYQISGSIIWGTTPTGTNTQLNIRLNGTTYIARNICQVASTIQADSIATLYQLAVNDFVELTALQSSGGAININSSGNYSPEFGMVRVA